MSNVIEILRPKYNRPGPKGLTPYELAVNRLTKVAEKMATELFPDDDEESRNRWDRAYADAMDKLCEDAGLRKSARKRVFFEDE